MVSATNHGRETTPVRLGTPPPPQPKRVLRLPAVSGRDRERVLLTGVKLHLHPHVAGDCCPDERVSLCDVGMGGKLRRYIILVLEEVFVRRP